MAIPSSKIPKELSNAITALRENHEPKDFRVKVDGEIFPCHSSILAICSDFFSGLLRSDMKEKQEMEVELKNISSTTFQFILNSLYIGCELLTKDNVCDVWSAVHQLQIQFLIEYCEDFVISTISLESIGIYKKYSDYLQCEKVNDCIFNFTCRCFQGFRKTEALLDLNFKDFKKIITSNTLLVSSVDEVLYSIFDWASYGDFSMTYRIADNATQTLNCVHKSSNPSNSTAISTNVNDSSDPTNTTEISTNVNDSSDPTKTTEISTNVNDSSDQTNAKHISTNVNDSSYPTNATEISTTVNDSSDQTNAKHISTNVNDSSYPTNATEISTNVNDSADQTNAKHISTNVNDSSYPTNATEISTNVNDSSDPINKTDISTNVIDASDLSNATHISNNVNASSNPTNTTQISTNVNDSSDLTNTTEISTYVNDSSNPTNTTQISTSVNDSSDPTNATQISADNDSPHPCMEIQTKNPQDPTHNTESVNEKDMKESMTHIVDLNERKTMLETLLKDTKYSTASVFCLTEIYFNNLTQNDTKVKDIILEAFSPSGYDHGFCSTTDIVRDCGEVRRVGVYCNEKDVRVLCFKDDTFFSISTLPLDGYILPFNCYKRCNLAVLNGELYACVTNTQFTYRNPIVPVIKLTPNGWEHVVDLERRFNDQFIVNGKYLYSISWMGIDKLNPNSNPIEGESFDFDLPFIVHAFSFQKYIFLFSSKSRNDQSETLVHSWNTEHNYLTEHKPIQFSSFKITSFCHRGDRYILDVNGSLWKLRVSWYKRNAIEFISVSKLWDGYCFPDNAFLFNETLFLVGRPAEKLMSTKVFGVFSSIRFCQGPLALTGHSGLTSNIVHCVMPSNWNKSV